MISLLFPLFMACSDSLGTEDNVNIIPDEYDKTNQPLMGTKWLLERFESDDMLTSFAPDQRDNDSYKFTLVFEDSVTAWGRSGCNDYTCKYKLNGSSINISTFSTTYVACELTAEYSDALMNSLEYAFDNDTLIITSDVSLMSSMYFSKIE